MAIYRPEQAQLTYAAEAAFAADPELAKGDAVTDGYTGSIAVANAGAIEITATLAASTPVPVVGDFIQIGTVNATTYGSTVVQHEIRRVEWFANTADDVYTFGLDRPLGFDHSGAAAERTITEIDGIFVGSTYANSKIITNVPGVYETVDAPDMDSGMEPQFFLGTKNRRSFQTIIKNQQTYDSSLEMTPLNGLPFRWAIGKVTTCAEEMDYGDNFSLLTGDHKKGDLIIAVDLVEKFGAITEAGVLSDGLYVTFVDSASSSTEAAASTTDAGRAANCDTAVIAMGANPESRRVVAGKVTATSATGVGHIWLDQPLQFDHDDDSIVAAHGSVTSGVLSTEVFRHVITETDVLDTMTWHIHMKDSAERGKTVSSATSAVPSKDFDFDRRYTGGKVGSASISGEESGLVTVNWDTINFRGMHHNNRRHNALSASQTPYNGASVTAHMPFFALMQDIQMSDVTYPTTEPYYFSDGQLKFFDEVFAQIRSFTLTMNNNTEARYYVQRSYGKFRGPNEIREQRREYGLTATVVLPDNTDNAVAVRVRSNATALFRELLLEGDYGKPGADIMKGFTASLRFDRGVNDFIIMDIPQSQGGDLFVGGTHDGDEGKPVFAQAGNPNADGVHGDSTTTDVGLFIRSAKHSLSTDAPLQVELDMLFKNMIIYIKDNEPSYI